MPILQVARGSGDAGGHGRRDRVCLKLVGLDKGLVRSTGWIYSLPAMKRCRLRAMSVSGKHSRLGHYVLPKIVGIYMLESSGDGAACKSVVTIFTSPFQYHLDFSIICSGDAASALNGITAFTRFAAILTWMIP